MPTAISTSSPPGPATMFNGPVARPFLAVLKIGPSSVVMQRCRCVLVQPEMGKRALSVSEYFILRAETFEASIRPPGYPSAWLRPAEPASVSPDHIIRSSSTAIRLKLLGSPSSGPQAAESLQIRPFHVRVVGFYCDWPRRRLHSPRAERMKVKPPSPPSAQSVQTKKKPPVDLAISP